MNSDADFPRGRLTLNHACPWCECPHTLDNQPTFKVTAIQAGIVVCQCHFCNNIFCAPGEWTFEDSDPEREARERLCDTILEHIMHDLGVDILRSDYTWRPERRVGN